MIMIYSGLIKLGCNVINIIILELLIKLLDYDVISHKKHDA